MRFWAFLSFFCLLSGGGLLAQSRLSLRAGSADSVQLAKTLKRLQLTTLLSDSTGFTIDAKDSTHARRLCLDIVKAWQQEGRMTAALDTFYRSGKNFTGLLHAGPVFLWTRLNTTGVEEAWLDAAGYRGRVFKEQPLEAPVLLRLQERLLEAAENTGYPFAAVWLDSIEVGDNGGVTARLRAEKGPYFVFKDIIIKGDLKLPRSFLLHYFGIRAGSPYSRAKVVGMEKSLRSLLFVESTAAPLVRFAQQEATVQLYANKKKTGRFDVILGLLPRSRDDRAATDARLLFTGHLDAAFQNAFNLGEHFSVQMERLRPETQKLEVEAAVPYLPHTAFGAAGQLHIFRRDSTWLEARGDAGISYGFTGGNQVRFFWENRTLSLIRVDTAAVRLSRQLPPDLDLQQNGFGVEGTWTHLDDPFNPRRGWNVFAKGVAGFSTIRRNAQIESMRTEDFEFKTLYDALTLRSTRYRAEIKAEAYFPFFRRTALKCALRSGGIFSAQPVYNNEQYRLGGHRLLRGFDEESLFATRYAVFTAEWRLLTGPRSFLAAFSDYGYLENLTDRNRLFLRPWGLGAGMNVETSAGIFGISLAVGRRDAGQGVDFRAAKFHLGYVNLF